MPEEIIIDVKALAEEKNLVENLMQGTATEIEIPLNVEEFNIGDFPFVKKLTINKGVNAIHNLNSSLLEKVILKYCNEGLTITGGSEESHFDLEIAEGIKKISEIGWVY